MRKLINRFYAQQRQLPDEGLDPRLRATTILGFVGFKLLARIRGLSRGMRPAYVERNVRIRGKGQLVLSRGVVLGEGARILATSENGVELGEGVTLDAGAVLRATGVLRNLGVGIKIGPRTAIGLGNVLLGQGGISIGSDCLLAPNVTVVSESHNFADATRTIRSQGETRLPTSIGDDVWVGASAVILGGATIGTGAVIAAGAVVRGHVAPYSVVAGVPARVIRMRSQ